MPSYTHTCARERRLKRRLRNPESHLNRRRCAARFLQRISILGYVPGEAAHVQSGPLQLLRGQAHAEAGRQPVFQRESRRPVQTANFQRGIRQVLAPQTTKICNSPEPLFCFRPAKGSLSESRGFKATISVCKEMLQLCEIINQHGEPLFTKKEKQNDPRKVISFGELFYVSE